MKTAESLAISILFPISPVKKQQRVKYHKLVRGIEPKSFYPLRERSP